jgi:hypothetical protein
MNLAELLQLPTSSEAVSKREAERPSVPATSVLPRTFHGERSEKNHRVFEQPWHRLAATLLASGRSQKEAAVLCGVTKECLNQVFRTPWFQTMVIELMEANGQNDIMALFKSELLNSHNTLIELRDNPQTSPAVRANISLSFIERIYGKATQRIETSPTANIADPLAEEQRLREENERLRAVTGGATSN